MEAAGLAPKDGRGLNNPYAKIVLGERRLKTEVKPETNNPTWNETFVLYVFALPFPVFISFGTCRPRILRSYSRASEMSSSTASSASDYGQLAQLCFSLKSSNSFSAAPIGIHTYNGENVVASAGRFTTSMIWSNWTCLRTKRTARANFLVFTR